MSDALLKSHHLLSNDYCPSVPFSMDFGRYTVKIANQLEELYPLLRLRHQVFFGSSENDSALDIDEYDFDADHLCLWDNEAQKAVGTYRLRNSTKIKEYYSASEFDCLHMIQSLPGIKVELGRACVHADYRNGVAVPLLWQGLGAYLSTLKAEWVFGCSSVNLESRDEKEVSDYCRWLLKNHSIHSNFVIQARQKHAVFSNFNLDQEVENMARYSPSLLKAYLRMGAKVCGEPAYDDQMNTIDFLTILEVNKTPEGMGKHFGIIQR